MKSPALIQYDALNLETFRQVAFYNTFRCVNLRITNTNRPRRTLLDSCFIPNRIYDKVDNYQLNHNAYFYTALGLITFFILKTVERSLFLLYKPRFALRLGGKASYLLHLRCLLALSGLNSVDEKNKTSRHHTTVSLFACAQKLGKKTSF